MNRTLPWIALAIAGSVLALVATLRILPVLPALVAFGILAGAALLVVLAADRASRVALGTPPPDGALENLFRRKSAGETNGVRWILGLYPSRLSVPGYAVATVVVHNTHDQIRTLDFAIDPGEMLPTGHSLQAALRPGEAGLLRIPLYLRQEFAIGAHPLRATLRVAAPRGAGKRLASLPKAPHRESMEAMLEVVSRHDGAAVNLFAYDWEGYTSLFVPPQTVPDLSGLRILEELPTFPDE